MYGTIRFHISRNRNPALFDYCTVMTEKSKNLRNAVLFIIRQWFTAYGKTSIQPLQKEVIDAVERTCRHYGIGRPGMVLSYEFIDKLMRFEKNPDYFSGLPMQSSQAIARETVREFTSWFSALDAYKKDPSSFTGRPKMPGYTKADKRMLTMTNQDCVIYNEDERYYLKLPKTKERMQVCFPDDARLKEVKIRPVYGEHEVILVYEQQTETEEKDMPYAAGIDLGVNNIAAFVGNDGGRPILYKGGAVKSMNRFCNKTRAELTAILMKGHDPKTVNMHTHRLDDLEKKRSFFIRDQMHKISRHIVKECVERNIGTIVIGKNDQWKTKVSMSKESNQKFVQIPHNKLIQMITYKAEREGIRVIVQEESYTSRASFMDQDDIPVYGEAYDTHFSGTRFTRGQYRTKKGTILSSDINGSANILRKAIPDAFEGISDYSFLLKAETIGFHELNRM